MSEVKIEIKCDDEVKLHVEGEGPALIALGIFSQKVCKVLGECDNDAANNIAYLLMSMADDFNDLFDKLTTGDKNERLYH